MKRQLILTPLLVSALFAFADNAPLENVDFRNGILIVNEGQYGAASGSLTFLGNDGTDYYNVFQRQNPGHQLGITSESGSVYGNRVFIVSKQAGDGQLLAVLDAATLKLLGEIKELPSASAQANWFSAVSEEKGYLSTTDGIYPVNLTDYTLGEKLTKDGLADSKYGQSLLSGNRLFVTSQRNGVVVVNTLSGEIEEVLDIPSVAYLAKWKDGRIIAATSDKARQFVAIDPETLLTTGYTIDESDSTLASPWGTWAPSSFAVDSETTEAAFYTTKAWGITTIARYDLADGTFNPSFITLPGTATGLEFNQELYGQGISYDADNGRLIVTAVESGYGNHFLQNWVYFYNTATGDMDTAATRHLEEGYWFPAMVISRESESQVAIDTPEAEENDTRADVFTASGILVRRNATASDLRALPAGLYIFGNKKIVIR